MTDRDSLRVRLTTTEQLVLFASAVLVVVTAGAVYWGLFVLARGLYRTLT